MPSEEKLKRVVIREELVALTKDHISALVLGQMLYWTERVGDFDKFLAEEREREPKLKVDYRRGWIYKTAAQLREELMVSTSAATLSRRLNDIVEAGWLERRRNPRHKWDRTWQYRVNLGKIEQDLSTIGYHLQGYKFDAVVGARSILQGDSSMTHPEPTIPETIPEITTEDIPETTHVVSVVEPPQLPDPPPPKRVTWRTEVVSESQRYLWTQYGRKSWRTRAERNLFVETERSVGGETMMKAAKWAAQNGIAKVPSICSAAKKMWKDRPAARASPQETHAVGVVYPDGTSEIMEVAG